ncbi:hypothetical protein NK6_848 [Bradyrhizobium diazoefficiens]|uniref:Uncharacterized protein n=1 Tax=Bradyrhizobium diazoefficiens TaxID=1355477 RepID=A0A0E4BJX8_9BRAD|nr:hypothetical protein NK6_848 [Bradyrhizobium diazoefficiens]
MNERSVRLEYSENKRILQLTSRIPARRPPPVLPTPPAA